MTSELWDDLTGMDRIAAILTEVARKAAKQRANETKRIQRRTYESDAAFAWRKSLPERRAYMRNVADNPYQLDPLPHEGLPVT